jgi:hypothetical protein
MSRRWVAILGLAVAVGLTFAGPATAETNVNYWGYNYLTSTNPGAGTCSGQGAGFACAGWNGWDRSQIHFASGNAIIYWGFQNCQNCTLKGGWSDRYLGTFTIIRYEWNQQNPSENPINPYNRTSCKWQDPGHDTYAYIQCRGIYF